MLTYTLCRATANVTRVNARRGQISILTLDGRVDTIQTAEYDIKF